MYCIYIFQNKNNHKIYVGKTNNFAVRLSKHKSISQKYPKGYFHRAIAKHGIDNFNYFIIEEFDNEKLCLEAEQFWIAYLKSLGSELYNMTDGGEGTSGHTWKLSATTRNKMSLAHQGEKHSVERRQANSLAQKGRKNPNFGKTISIKQKENISAAMKGKFSGEKNPSAKLNLEIANQIRNNYKSIPSSRKLAQKYGVSPSTILHILRDEVWVN